MSGKRIAGVLAAVAMIGLGWAYAAAQDAPGGNRGNRGNRAAGPGGGADRMAEARKAMSDRMKEQFGCTDDQWKALQPMIDKVQTLQRDARGGMGGMGGMMGGRGRGGNQPGVATPAATTPPAAPDPNARPQSDLEKKGAELQKLLQDKASTPEAIKLALAAFRDARVKAEEELNKAQNELRAVLSARQEAQAVAWGLLK